MVSPAQLPEIRTELFVDGDIRGADDALQVVDPAERCGDRQLPSRTELSWTGYCGRRRRTAGRRPADGSLVGYAAASAKQAQDAVAAAHRAFPVWAARSPRERAALLTAALAPLEADRPATAEVLTRENGKIRIESWIDCSGLRDPLGARARARRRGRRGARRSPGPPYRDRGRPTSRSAW